MKILRNTTKLEQCALVGGKQYFLQPHEEKPLPDQVADAFLTDCPGLVIEMKGDLVGAVDYRPVEKPETMWIANMLGDPDAPDKVKVKQYNTQIRRYEYVEIDNPFKYPRPVVREHGGAMVEYMTQDGLAAKNMPSTYLGVPPYQRREFPVDKGRWFLTRDGNIQPAEFRGQVQLSRPKSAFEPDMNWELDDMRAYLRLMDRKVEIGPSQKELVERYKSDKSELEIAVYDAKMLCMRRLHFRVAKASARLYSKAEFEEFRRGFEKPAPSVSVDQAMAAVAKNLSSSSASPA